MLWFAVLGAAILLFLALTYAPVFAQVTIPEELRPRNAPSAGGQDYGADNADARAIAYSAYGVQVLIIGKVITILLQLAGVVAVYYIAANAWAIASAAGSQEKIDAGKRGLTWAVVGLVSIILSYSVFRQLIEITLTAEEQPGSSETPGSAVPTL